MTFLKLYGYFWKQCWFNSYWYLALAIFIVVPFINTESEDLNTMFRFPWWTPIYMSIQLLNASLVVTGLRYLDKRIQEEDNEQQTR